MTATSIKSAPVVDESLALEHGLSRDEFARVQEILDREPTYTELGIFAVMWSEHCSYKSSRPSDGLPIFQSMIAAFAPAL